mmetsp:Transcript_14259/g.40471  ORF Transcript_14259/g.40471 Transcript_14259/m.40471 type:complete len:116 (+) Transcript_14259:1862-2209(+)
MNPNENQLHPRVRESTKRARSKSTTGETAQAARTNNPKAVDPRRGPSSSSFVVRSNTKRNASLGTKNHPSPQKREPDDERRNDRVEDSASLRCEKGLDPYLKMCGNPSVKLIGST